MQDVMHCIGWWAAIDVRKSMTRRLVLTFGTWRLVQSPSRVRNQIAPGHANDWMARNFQRIPQTHHRSKTNHWRFTLNCPRRTSHVLRMPQVQDVMPSISCLEGVAVLVGTYLWQKPLCACNQCYVGSSNPRMHNGWELSRPWSVCCDANANK